MPVRQTIPFTNGTFFITFTCHEWIHLIEKVNGYDIVYKWFDVLKDKGHHLNSFVIMPNHVHALISFIKTDQSINTIIGNGKRFMAYEIIKRLKQKNEHEILSKLASDVNPTRRMKNKKHEVWELSFDWKECYSIKFMNQKIDYIHDNPCNRKWDLTKNPEEYSHSSARFYITGEHGMFPVTNIMEMEDVVFEKVNRT